MEQRVAGRAFLAPTPQFNARVGANVLRDRARMLSELVHGTLSNNIRLR